MPLAPGRDHADDLLLCGHHYRASREALAAAGAAVFDDADRRVMPQAWALVNARSSLVAKQGAAVASVRSRG